MEDKQKILDYLLPALQATFNSGSTKYANVEMDSGTSMIRDVIAQIV